MTNPDKAPEKAAQKVFHYGDDTSPIQIITNDVEGFKVYLGGSDGNWLNLYSFPSREDAESWLVVTTKFHNAHSQLPSTYRLLEVSSVKSYLASTK